MFAPKPFDVAKEMVRVTSPRPDCYGQLIQTIRHWCANPEISSSYSPHHRRFHQPHDVGAENNVIERFAGAGVQREDIIRQNTYTFNFPKPPQSSLMHSENTRANHECIRSCRKEHGRAADLQKELKICSTAKQRPEQECHIHSCDFLTRHCCA
jgi:hypothetical protein